MMTVQVRYYTDPACPWSWAAKPALRRLMWEFEAELEFVWVMGGLARGTAATNATRRAGSATATTASPT
jgi:protein-disulfide isomerase-like protein with CxxC motif